MDTRAIVDAHRASNALPRVHPSRRLTTPDGGQVEIDARLVPLMAALWARGITTVASCQNVREFVAKSSPVEFAATLADDGPLSHADSTRHGRGYLRLVDDQAAAGIFLKAAGPHLARVARLGQLVQIEFDPDSLPRVTAAAEALP